MLGLRRGERTSSAAYNILIIDGKKRQQLIFGVTESPFLHDTRVSFYFLFHF